MAAETQPGDRWRPPTPPSGHRSGRARRRGAVAADRAWCVQLIRVWRLCRARHAAFDGEGAWRSGGRWNHPGSRVVYASASLSLAALEVFVHLDRDEAPEDLVAIPADLPTSLKTASVDITRLPAAWRTYPALPALADLGTAWIRKGTTAVLVVPSAVVPSERNYLLNPAHRGFRTIRIGRSQPFSFDPRMWETRRRGGGGKRLPRA